MRGLGLWCVLSLCILPAFCQTPARPGTGWPKELDDSGAHFVIYQPEAESWKDGELRTRAVVMISEAAGKPRFGTISISAHTKEDADHRSVTLENIEVVSGDFPSGAADQERALGVIRKHLSEWPRSLPLDRLRTDLGIVEAEKTAEVVPLKNVPPKVIFSPRRAVLVLVDGDPVFHDVEGTKYKRVINTPALILQDTSDQRLYLDGDGRWMTATALEGPWNEAQPAPAELERVKAQIKKATEAEQRDAQPAPSSAANANRQQIPLVAPVVHLSTVPAELIQTKGKPEFSPIPGTQLTYVTNSENDIFMYLPTQEYYTLISGRWFSAKVLRGQWNTVGAGELPPDFSKIPADSPKASVLASVPDTPQARQAVISTEVPQTAAVKRKDAKLTVTYDGEPQFKPIEHTSLEYAINTSTDVIRADDKYYACHNAVWFVSATPTGPWVVADYIPAEIYRIPASSPLYHVRYVRVYSATPDWVYFGYTPGYMGAYVWNGAVVFGTGWAYPGWYGRFYFGWPWTWGLGFRFGFWGGGWFWHPWGWGGGWYHPFWGARAWYGGYWGHGWLGRGGVWARNVNVYNRWGGSTVVTRNAQARGQTARMNQAQAGSHSAAQKTAANSRTASSQSHAAGQKAGGAKNTAGGKNAAGANHAGRPGGAGGQGAHAGKAGGAHAKAGGGGRR